MASRKLEKLIQPLVENLGYEFVGLEYSGNPKSSLLRIYIDHQKRAVDLDDCQQVSGEIAALLDVEDAIRGRYNLEVSSPGLDRPLFTLEHFRQFIGETASVSVYAPLDKRRKFKGEILAVEEDQVILEQDGTSVRIAFDNIARSRLAPNYDDIFRKTSGA